MTRCGQWLLVGSGEEKEISRVFISALNSSAAYLESINQSLDSYNYDNKAVADIIMDNVQKVKFEGISVMPGIFHLIPRVINISAGNSGLQLGHWRQDGPDHGGAAGGDQVPDSRLLRHED